MNYQSFQNEASNILEFQSKYGYFSPHSPIIARVTDDPKDLIPIIHLFEEIFLSVENSFQAELMCAEVLSKGLAYRNLKPGMEILIPNYEKKKKMVLYRVDRIFDLGFGMPAFGLVPKTGTAAPILLFRGTDLSVDTLKGWASILSNLHIKGAAYTAFHRVQPLIHEWLVSVALKGPKARVMGFSQGGILAGYTMLYENEFLSHASSYAFNTPGFFEEVYDEWAEKQRSMTTIITEGDLISKIGYLFGEVYVFYLEQPLNPISAHVGLITTSSLFYRSKLSTQPFQTKP